jgi:4-nitrophenyl phosphatase
MAKPLSAVRGLLLDMDGVLWRGQRPLPGLHDFFGVLRQRGLRLQLVSNNATLTPQGVQARLAGLGVQVDLGEVLTSSLAAASFLAELLPPGSPVYAIGQDGLRSALRDSGLQVLEQGDEARAVVVGMDFQVTWDKLAEAAYALARVEHFVATNPDRSFPTERGLAPGNGAILAALQAATGREPLVVGKPEPHLFREGLRRMRLPAEAALAAGDRLDTDILAGQRAGAATALLLTGVTRAEDLPGSTIQPDWVFPDLPALTAALGEAGSR